MIRTKTGLVGLLVLVTLFLAACSSGPVREAHMATGDINDPNAMKKTSSFGPGVDLNVVVMLNSHNRDLPVYAVFTAPAGAGTYTTDTIEVGPTAGTVLLGLDWEMTNMALDREPVTNTRTWPTGEWTVEIYVDGEREDTLKFTVEDATPTPAPAG